MGMTPKRPGRKARGPSPLSLLLYAVLVVVVLAGVVLFVVYRDDIDGRTLSGLLNFLRPAGREAESAAIHFDTGQSNLFALCDGRLAVLSPERLALYNGDGTERFSSQTLYKTPALCAGGGRIVAYDRGGAGCIVTDGRDILARPEGPVSAASLNERGWYVLVTAQSGYRGVATLYNDRCSAVFHWYSAERYILAAGLSPSGSRMAVGAVSQEGETVESLVTFLKTDSETPLAQISIPDEIVLSVTYPDNTHVCAVTDRGAYFYTDRGDLLGSYSFDGDLLLGLQPAGESLCLLLGRYENGMYSRLCMLGYDGREKALLPFEEGPAALSAAGRYCSVLVGATILTYDDTGALAGSLTGQGEARRLLQKPDGSLLVIDADAARSFALFAE